jgi:HD-like signal output (HDOD) protein
MSTRFEPMGLAALANLAMRADLPALPTTLQAAVSGLRNPDLSAPALTELLLNDPTLSASLLREVGRQIRQRSTLTINSIGHCLTLLGMERVGTLVRLTPTLAAESKDNDELHYREAIVTSLHAAAHIGDWQRLQPLLHFEQCYMGGLLMRLPEWGLWKQAPKEMKMIEALVRRYDIPRHEAEKLILGCTLNEVTLRVAQEWRFSDVMQAALDTRHLPPVKELLRWARKTVSQHQAQISYRDEGMHRIEISGTLRAFIANCIAVEGRHDWHSKGMRRCVLLLAAYLEISQEAAWARIRDTVLALAREVPDPMTAQLAAGLLWPAKGTPPRRIPEPMRADAIQKLYNNEPVKTVLLRGRNKTTTAAQPTVATSTSPPTAAPASSSADARPGSNRVYAPESAPPMPPTVNKPVLAKQPGFASVEHQRQFEQHIARLLGNGMPFKIEHEVIRANVDILRDNTSLERIVVALVHLNRDNITSYYAVGCEKVPGLRRFEIKLQPPNLFTRLIKQAAAVWMSPERQKDAGLMPGHFKQATQMDSYFAASLFNSKGAFAVLYADKGNSYAALAESDYQIFRILVNATNKCLAAMKS